MIMIYLFNFNVRVLGFFGFFGVFGFFGGLGFRIRIKFEPRSRCRRVSCQTRTCFVSNPGQIRTSNSWPSRMRIIRIVYLRIVHPLQLLLRSMHAVLMFAHIRMHQIELCSISMTVQIKYHFENSSKLYGFKSRIVQNSSNWMQQIM